MNDTSPHSALREWRAHMVVPVRMAVLAGVAVILAVMGPFESDTAMRFVPRLAYWAVIVVVGYSIGYLCSELAGAWAKDRGPVAQAALAAPLTTIGVTAAVYLLNGLALDVWADGRALAILAGNVFVVSAIINAVFQVADLSEAAQSTPTAPPPNATPPALLERLAFDKRAPLVALSVEDHYVRIRTTKGEDMVLMRLADAIREVGDTAGLQVHRSHWIALDQVTNATRKGDGAVITLTHGPDIPVSRANVPALRKAGLLPK